MEPVSFTALTAPAPALLRQAQAVSIVEIRKGSFIEQRLAVMNLLEGARGTQLVANQKRVPRATVGDALQIVRAWDQAIRRFGNKSGDNDKSSKKRWRAFVAKSLNPQFLRPRRERLPAALNERFWKELSRVAIWLDSLSAIVPRWRMAVDSLSEATKESPKVVGDSLVALGEAAGAAVAAPVKGLAEAFGITPRNILFGLALVGAGVVLVRKASK